MSNVLQKLLCNIEEIKFHQNFEVKNLNTFKISASLDLIEVYSESALIKVVKTLYENKIKYMSLGKGSNFIPHGKLPCLIQVKYKILDNISFEDLNEIELPANFPIAKLISLASRFNIQGLEVLTGIPASLGGCIAMNAGTSLGEISSIAKKVVIIKNDGTKKELELTPESFSYRNNKFLNDGDIVSRVVLDISKRSVNTADQIKKYLNLRNQSQPLSKNTCGCVFKNPPEGSAGRLIDSLGLKGARLGNMRVSPVHGNFFENLGESTINDFLELANLVRNEVYTQRGIQLQFEVRW